MLVERGKSHPLFREILLRKISLFFRLYFMSRNGSGLNPINISPMFSSTWSCLLSSRPEAKTRSVRVRLFCRSRRLGWLMVSNVKRFTTERMLITFHSYDKYIIYCWILNARLLRTINFIYFPVNLYHYDVYIHTYPLSDPIEVEVTHTKEETKHPTSRSYLEDFSSRKTCGTCLKL